MKKLLLLTLASLLLLPMSAAAFDDDDDEWFPLQFGSISFRVGGFFPQGESDIWTENVDTFTFEVSDFNNYTIGLEFNWFLSNLITLGFGFDYYSKTIGTEYRDFIGDDGAPILQELKLEVIPLTATVKITPLGNGSPGYNGERGSPIVPWVGGGIGAYNFSYSEIGEFIDFTDDSIFEAEFFIEDETALGFHIAGGIVIPVGFNADFFGEARYAWAEGELGPDFLGFDPIDLGGFSFTFGASYRF